MKEPIRISKEAVIAIQEDLLGRFSGLPGVSDDGLLESVLHRPLQLFANGSSSLFDLAASYAAGIIGNHPFLDGNKRAGFMTAYVFLGINGQDVDATEEDVVIQTLALAAGTITEAAYAEWLKRVSIRARR